MKARRTWAVARKEFIHIIRDPRALGIAIVLPLVLLFLFGFALTLDVDNVPIMVWDQNNTPASRDLVERFTGSRYFTLAGTADNYRSIVRAVDRRDALMALVIPTDFERKLESGRGTDVQLLVDGSDANTASLAIGYARAIVQTYAGGVQIRLARRMLGRPLSLPLELYPRVWYNTDMDSTDFIVPGLIAVIMMIIAALLTSLTVAREWETGTMEQLISTPLRGAELIIGKLIPYFAIGMLDMLLSVLMGRFVFGVPLRGSVLALFGMSSVFLVGALALGIFISITTKNQLMASQFAFVLTFLPAFLLSGFMFDIANMPKALQFVTYLVPARYFVTMLRGLYLKGVGPAVLWSDGIFLVIFAVLMLALSLKKFKKQLA